MLQKAGNIPNWKQAVLNAFGADVWSLSFKCQLLSHEHQHFPYGYSTCRQSLLEQGCPTVPSGISDPCESSTVLKLLPYLTGLLTLTLPHTSF